MSAEAAKEQAAAMIDKIEKDYDLGKGHLNNENQKNLREWIYGGIDQLSEIINPLSKFKQAESLLKRLEKVIRKPNGRIMCYSTKKVLNKRFLPNRKNGWNPPVCTDERFIGWIDAFVYLFCQYQFIDKKRSRMSKVKYQRMSQRICSEVITLIIFE